MHSGRRAKRSSLARRSTKFAVMALAFHGEKPPEQNSHFPVIEIDIDILLRPPLIPPCRGRHDNALINLGKAQIEGRPLFAD